MFGAYYVNFEWYFCIYDTLTLPRPTADGIYSTCVQKWSSRLHFVRSTPLRCCAFQYRFDAKCAPSPSLRTRYRTNPFPKGIPQFRYVGNQSDSHPYRHPSQKPTSRNTIRHAKLATLFPTVHIGPKSSPRWSFRPCRLAITPGLRPIATECGPHAFTYW